MHCVANFEVESEVSVVSDDLVLKIKDPNGAFRAQIRNIPRSEFTIPLLLSFHIYFEAPNLEDAQDIADDLLASCLNLLAFTSGSGFRKHRIRQIVNAEPPLKLAMRDVRMWGERIEYDDPQPFLTDQFSSSIERLLEFDIPPAIQRALRWYRLGIVASAPDDQFTYFWFALEIVAEFQKPTTKVHDKCARCQSPLYCEQCEKYPLHRPYAKQAIRELMKAADKTCDDETVELLDKTRNSLMHGTTLKEIESELPDPRESVVDTLGRILWKVLIRQFPKEMFDGKLIMGVPSTYVHYKVNSIAQIQTVVPVDSNGNFDLEFKGMTMAMQPFGPPQSASPIVLGMTPDQYDRLGTLSYTKGDHQEMLRRIHGRVQEREGNIYALVLATDMSLIRQAMEKKQDGPWQDLLREILEPNVDNEAQ